MQVEKRPNILPLLVLQLGFAVAGIGDTVLGPILPSLAPVLHLSDNGSGLLMTILFVSSSCGALLSRGNISRALGTGFFLTGVGAGLLAVSSPKTVMIFCLVYGLGLGMSMTATSLLVGRNYPERRGSILALVNFIWSLGAAISPVLVSRIVALHTFRWVFVVIAGGGFLTSVLVYAFVRDREEQPELQSSMPNSGKGSRQITLLMILFASLLCLETGIEATVGGWLSTFALRIMTLDAVKAAAVSSFFWTAFLVGRALATVILLRVKEEQMLIGSLGVSFLGMISLFFIQGMTGLAIASILGGLGAASIFPTAVSLLMANTNRPSIIGAALALCGIGGAFFPWLAGFISTYTGSIRYAMALPPVMQFLMMILLSIALMRKSHREEEA